MNIIEIFNLLKGILSRPQKEWLIVRKLQYSWLQMYFYITIPLVFLVSLISSVAAREQLLDLGITPNWMLFANAVGSLAGIALAAFFISKLSPRFKGQESFDRMVAIISLSYTPVFIATALASLHPTLQFVNFIGLIYMVFLFYRGLEIVIDIPVRNLMGFTIISLIILFAARLIITSVVAAFVLAFSGGIESIPADF